MRPPELVVGHAVALEVSILHCAVAHGTGRMLQGRAIQLHARAHTGWGLSTWGCLIICCASTILTHAIIQARKHARKLRRAPAGSHACMALCWQARPGACTAGALRGLCAPCMACLAPCMAHARAVPVHVREGGSRRGACGERCSCGAAYKHTCGHASSRSRACTSKE